MSMQREAGVNVGVDVGKQQFDVFTRERAPHFTVANDLAGIRVLLSRLGRHRLAGIVVEATGRREHGFVLAAAERGWPIIVFRPLAVRRYASAEGILAKTDIRHHLKYLKSAIDKQDRIIDELISSV